MPRKQAHKCYFGCTPCIGTVHRFPPPEYPNTEKFNQWKMVLSEVDKEKGDNYIYNNVRLCDHHFEDCYRTPSKRLTKNAIPTLNIASTSKHIGLVSALMKDSVSEEKRTTELKEVHSPLCQASTSKHTGLVSSIMKDSGSEEKRKTELTEVHSPLCQASTSQIVLSHATTTRLDVNLHTKVITTDRCFRKNIFKAPTQMNTAHSREMRQLTVRILKLRNKCKSLNQKVRQASKLSKNQAFLKAVERLPEPAAIFTHMQLTKTHKMPRGRRFSMKEKILSLTIFKQSPKAYNLLQRLFCLPSKRTIQKMLSSIFLVPGINNVIIDYLKKTARKLSSEKKLCTLLFDEVALTPGLYYQRFTDEIVGFEDFGEKRTKNIADHALVFMLKSLKGKYKQPLAFTFCQSATKSTDLKQLIKIVIEQIQTTGLTIISTICDQSATNMSVINSFLKDTKEKYLRNEIDFKGTHFEINENKIFPIFDPPHLLKGVRNNLLTKNLRFTQNDSCKIAEWSHLQMLLDVDVGEQDIRLVNKLTDYHVNKDKIPKMKVKYAAQVFSQRVSAAMRFLANHNILPKECLATADLLLLMDKLFDSFNGHSYQDGAKVYKCALKKNSPHWKLWDEMLPILRTMQFEAKKDGKYIQVPSVKNWVHNINVMKEMFSYINEYYNVSSLLMRNLNQDPLENFFCNIRSNGIRNISPTCSQFIGAYKTLLVNNLTSSHSVGANCEKDNNKILKPLKCLLNLKTVAREEPDVHVNVDSLINLFEQNTSTQPSNIVSKEAKRYVAGYLVHKCIKKVCKNCQLCKMQLLSTTPPTDKDFILERDYTRKSCKYPSEALCSFLNDVCLIIQTQLNEEPHTKNIKLIITEKVNIFCNFTFLSCQNHNKKLYSFLINLIINVNIHSWCTNVNRLLKGKLKCNVTINDNIKLQATKYNKAHCHKRKK